LGIYIIRNPFHPSAHVALFAQNISRNIDSLIPPTMASLASSLNPGPSVEERLQELQSEMEKLKAQVCDQARIMLAIDNSGEKNWDRLNQELFKLWEDFNEAKEADEEFTEATNVQFKDATNVHGNFRKRLCIPKNTVKRLVGECPKKSPA
jgi:hypothetical protein